MQLQYLNHAAVLLRVGDMALLTDPWLSGTAFADGWGLRFDNPDAMARAKTATHLWISHWHSDHLHAPTLAQLGSARPDMTVIANVSANFSMVERLASFGFRNIVTLHERKPLSLGGGIEVTRYPTAGIDNTLHLRAPGWSIVNYNDCNLPADAIAAMRRNIGPIDLLLTNYNHAGKLFSLPDDETIRDALWDTVARTVDLLSPTRAMLFASNHYYRTPYSADQNSSLLDLPALQARAAGDDRYLLMAVGDEARIATARSAPALHRRQPPLPQNDFAIHDYGAPVPWEQVLSAAAERCRQIRDGFGPLARLLPPLCIHVEDHGRNLLLTPSGPREVGDATHIETHSDALMSWLGRRFGDDTFVAGAHFRILDPDTRAIERWALFTLLDASHMDPRRSLQALSTRHGLGFWWARREEIWTTLVGGRLRAGQIRL